MEEKHIGILLQMLPYLGKSRILKVFTKEEGLVVLMAKRPSVSALTSPFCMAEWVYKKGQREIHTLLDGSLIDTLSSLRQSYDLLSAAGRIATDLLQSQLPGNQSPELFDLLSYYFRKLAEAHHPRVFADSFRLKLLLHEGLLSLHPECSLCKEEASALGQGESVCLAHAHPSAIVFTREEWQPLCTLAATKSFAAIQAIAFQPNLHEKIDRLFEQMIRR